MFPSQLIFLSLIPWVQSAHHLSFSPAGHLQFQISPDELAWSGGFVITNASNLNDSFLLNPLNLIYNDTARVGCEFRIDQNFGEELLFEWNMTPFLLSCNISAFNGISTDQYYSAVPIPSQIKQYKLTLGNFGVKLCIEELHGMPFTCDRKGGNPVFPIGVRAVNVKCGCQNQNNSTNFMDLQNIVYALSPNLRKAANFTDEFILRDNKKNHFIQRQEGNKFVDVASNETISSNTIQAVTQDPFVNDTNLPIKLFPADINITTPQPTTTVITTTPIVIATTPTTTATTATTSATTSTTSATTPTTTATTTAATTPTTTATTPTTTATTPTTTAITTTTIDPCLNFCYNNGSCFFDGNISELGCKCPAHYFGQKCEVFSLCTNSSCLNGGVCYMKDNQTAMCNCSLQYTGSKCEIFNSCYVPSTGRSPCVRGTCTITNNGSYHCSCPAQYTGIHCQLKDVCLGNGQCLNGGTCEPVDSQFQNASFVCHCDANYVGEFCETISLGNKGGLSGGEIAAICVCILLAACLSVATYFLVKWIRNSRRLKGKYNPAKEEYVANNGPPLPLADLNAKEERLI